MGKPKAPTPPDPKETAAAQTGTNVSTSIANAALGNVNQVTPYGNLTYNQSGTHKFTDPTTGKTIDVPTYTATQTLSPSQQAIFEQSQQAQGNLAKIGNQQSAFLADYLNKPMDFSNLPAGGDASKINTPQYQQFQSGPQLSTQIADAGAIQTQLGDAGQITKDYGPKDGYAGNVQQVQDALFSRLNPQLDRQRQELETSLANQGIRIGSTAYDTAMNQYNQGVNDQRTSVLLAAGQEQSRLANLDAQRAGFQNAAQQQQYNQLLGSGQFANAAQQQQFAQNATQGEFGNTARQQMFQNQNSVTGQNNALQDQRMNAQLAQFNAANQQRQMALQEAYARRAQPINEITSLLSGAQVQNPNFVNTNMPNIPTVDYAGLVNENYNQRLGVYNQQMAQRQGLLGGLLGLGSSAIMASDRRAKKDIKKRGRIDGTNIYEFRYRGEDGDAPKHIGVMAQEVEKTRPEAVTEIGGVKHVDYGKALPGLFGLGQAS